MNKILVTGGAGYIGSHTIVDLIEHGFDVISIDNFSNSQEQVFDSIKNIRNKTVINYNIDLKDARATKKVFEENKDIKGFSTDSPTALNAAK